MTRRRSGNSSRRSRTAARTAAPQDPEEGLPLRVRREPQTLRELEDYEEPRTHPGWASVSPDSSMVVFSRQCNLYIMGWDDYMKIVEARHEKTGEAADSAGDEGGGEGDPAHHRRGEVLLLRLLRPRPERRGDGKEVGASARAPASSGPTTPGTSP